MTELERYREALQAFDHTFDSIKEHAKHGEMTINSEILQQAIRQMKHDAYEFATIVKNALWPPPEMEEVEITAGWVNVYQNEGEDPFCGTFTHTTKRDADTADADTPRIDCQAINVTVKRPKKQPVEKSVSVEAAIRADGVITSACPTPIQPFMQHPECHGKTVILTATWTE